MILFRLGRILLALVGIATLCGCFPPGQAQDDETKETHFQAGRARANSMDYPGAIEAFEKALELNPRSASAHFELGSLFADKAPDPAAAIYHFEQFLKLRPKAENAEIVRQLVFRLKQELAKAVLPLPSTPGVQRELEQLAEENRRLRDDNARLTDELSKWRAFGASHGAATTNALVGGGPRTALARSGSSLAVAGGNQRSQGQGNSGSGTTQLPTGRTHKVQAGETLAAIAKRYGIKLDALLAANPGLNPRRLKVGQSLTIPSR